MDLATEEGPGGQHHGFRPEAQPHLGHHAGDPVPLQHQIVRRLLENTQIGLAFQDAPNGRLVERAVGLGPGSPYRRALASVQDPELDAAQIRGLPHGSAESIDLLHQMAFADAANRWITRHLTQGFDVVGQKQRLATHARCGQGGLGTGMAATDNDHVKIIRIEHDDPEVEMGAQYRRLMLLF